MPSQYISVIYWIIACILSLSSVINLIGLRNSDCPRREAHILAFGWTLIILALAALFFFVTSIGQCYAFIFFTTPVLCSLLVTIVGNSNGINCQDLHTFSVYIIFALGTSVFLFYFTVAVCYYLGSSHAWPELIQNANSPRRHQPIHVDFVEVDRISFKMGMSSSPGRRKGRVNRSLEADLDRLKSAYGVTRIVSMLDPFAVEKMGLQSYAQKCRERGITFHSIPLRDKWIPMDSKFLHSVIQIYRSICSTNEVILVHCNGGRGRTAVFAVCLLLLFGLSYREATIKVREARPRMLRNPLQILYCFHCWLFQVLTTIENRTALDFGTGDMQSSIQSPESPVRAFESPATIAQWNPETSLPEMSNPLSLEDEL